MSLAELVSQLNDGDLAALNAICGQAETFAGLAGGALSNKQDAISSAIRQAYGKRVSAQHRARKAQQLEKAS